MGWGAVIQGVMIAAVVSVSSLTGCGGSSEEADSPSALNAQAIKQAANTAGVERRVKKAVVSSLAQDPQCNLLTEQGGALIRVYVGKPTIELHRSAGQQVPESSAIVTDPTGSIGVTPLISSGDIPSCLKRIAATLRREFPQGIS